jgi:hypothetical protein
VRPLTFQASLAFAPAILLLATLGLAGAIPARIQVYCPRDIQPRTR